MYAHTHIYSGYIQVYLYVHNFVLCLGPRCGLDFYGDLCYSPYGIAGQRRASITTKSGHKPQSCLAWQKITPGNGGKRQRALLIFLASVRILNLGHQSVNLLRARIKMADCSQNCLLHHCKWRMGPLSAINVFRTFRQQGESITQPLATLSFLC